MAYSLESLYQPAGDQPQAINLLAAGLAGERRHQVLLGVTGSGKTYTIANVIAKSNKPTLVLAHNKTLAAQLYQEYRSFFPNNAVRYFVSYYDYYQPEAYLPTTDTYIEKTADINDEIERLRMAAMHSILTEENVIVIASVSCIYNIGQPSEHNTMKLWLQMGKHPSGEGYNLQSLASQLAGIQYARNDLELVPGSFQIKGDALYIYPPYQEYAWRIEFWGEEIEAIRAVEPLTRNPLFTKKMVHVYPAKAYIVQHQAVLDGIKEIQVDLEKQVEELEKDGKIVEAKRLQQRTRYDLNMLQNAGYCSGIENYSRYFDGRQPGEAPYSLLDYFPKDYLVVIDESHITIPQVRGMFNGDKARKQTLIDYGFRLPSALDNRPLKFDEFYDRLGQTIYTTATPAEWEMEQAAEAAKKYPLPEVVAKIPAAERQSMYRKGVIEQIVRPTGLVDPEITVLPTDGQVQKILEMVKTEKKKGYRTLITTLTKRLAEDLSEFLGQRDVSVTYLHSEIDTLERVKILQELRQGVHDVLVGVNLLREGIDLPEVSLVIILDADKQGFLRSRSSLIQLIGRAARNVDGKVVLFADNYQPEKWSQAMREAIEESNRRRTIQIAYNQKHNITPKSISKSLENDLLAETLANLDESEKEESDLVHQWKKAEQKEYIKKLEKEMEIAAQSLEFEKAAKLRDRIKLLKQELEVG